MVLTPSLSRTRQLTLSAVSAALVLLLSACGGAKEQAQETDVAAASPEGRRSAMAAAGTSREDAYRLLTQATFGPTSADVSRVQSIGVDAWLSEQLAMPAKDVHLARWRATDARVKKQNGASASAGANDLISSIYQQGLQGTDQVRQRVKLALSEIFVVSTNELSGPRAEMAASYYDMLGRNALGNFRTLLQDVAMHPAMGSYLSHRGNMAADPVTGRLPDQNFAREVMQLFTIGLTQLNADGTVKTSAGQPISTYEQDDVAGMAAVFTGFSWAGPDTAKGRFWGGGSNQALVDKNRNVLPMQAYAQFHSVSAKQFLGTQVPAQATPNPAASLNVALDTLFNHPNVGPFIGRQLIQRLVTSSPSPAYVARVSAVFANNGKGQRGDMKAVIRAVLSDAEARDPAAAGGANYGKVKEPMLRLTAWLRAFNAKSDSGTVLMSPTDDAALGLNQTPLRSPSVFNFFRPGYVPAGGEADAARMTLPEMQITDETSIAGYANYMMGAVQRGVGPRGPDGMAARPDLQPNYTAEMAVAEDAKKLVNLVLPKLLPGTPSVALTNEIVAAVNAQTIPPKRANNSNAAARTNAMQRRVQTAVLLALVSPEFIVQK